MQFIKTLTRIFFFILFPIISNAQSTFLQQGSSDITFLERMEIKLRTNADLNFSGIKPINRKKVVMAMEAAEAKLGNLNDVDRYNLNRLYMNSSEWYNNYKSKFNSKKPWFNTFYKTQNNFFEVNEKDFFLAINPVIQYQYMNESDNGQNLFLNSRGVVLRGLIANKIGFASYLTENQERPPMFVQNYFRKRSAVQGAGFFKEFKGTGFDYFDARGYITVNAAKYVDIQFGYDKNILGSGYRSLFLSDFSNNYLFLKLNTSIWKLNYQNIFMELFPQYERRGDRLLPRKYATMHHLSINVTPWLNVGVFESIVFGRPDKFDFAYLNPVIFFRSVEQQAGSPDNAMLGLDAKANLPHGVQLYGQLLFDEFKLDEFTSNRGWWGNKWAFQLGAKYIDAFNIPNLDLQVEANRVRPFTYSHTDTIANYTHYNQPLAHPLGASFQEYIGVLRYQPLPKLNIQGRAIYYHQGTDTAGLNLGSDIFLLNSTRPGEFGFEVGSGRRQNVLNSSLAVSYELKPNLFIEGSYLHRSMKFKDDASTKVNTNVVSLGVRLNMHRREYDY